MSKLSNLTPLVLWELFNQIFSIPYSSNHEETLAQPALQLAKQNKIYAENVNVIASLMMNIKKVLIFALPSLMAVNAYANSLPFNTTSINTIDAPSQENCQIISNNNGLYDVGLVNSGKIKSDKETPLNIQKSMWTISCTQATTLSVRASDNRSNTSTHANSWQFGLGNTNGSGKLGYYEAWLLNPKVDGHDAKLLQDGMSIPVNSAAIGNYSLSWVRYDSNKPVKGRIFSAEIEIKPVLASLDKMHGSATDTTNLDGSIVLYFSSNS